MNPDDTNVPEAQFNEVVDASLSRLQEARNMYVNRSHAASTLRAYRSDWMHFTRWCESHALTVLPADTQTVELYLTELAEAGYKVSTLSRRISSISVAHQAAGYDSPTRTIQVRTLFRGIRATHGVGQTQKRPLRTDELRRITRALPDTYRGVRDRALLVIGFAGALRRSELVALDVEDVEFTEQGLTVRIRSSKTDQEGEGETIGLPYGSHPETCPVRVLRAWLNMAEIATGPIFRRVRRGDVLCGARITDQTVAHVVRRYAATLGYNPADFGGHSLRAGLATAAAEGGAPERAIMAQTQHKSVQVVRRYIRKGTLFTENAAAYTGL